MPRRRRGERGRPWYDREKDCWSIRIDGRKITFRKPDGSIIHGKDGEQEATRAWHQMMAKATAPNTGDNTPMSVIFELFLEDLCRRAKPTTVKKYAEAMNDFVAHNPGLTCDQIRPVHLYDWWDKHPTWGESMKHIAGQIVHTALNWAAGAQSGNLITRNRLRGMKMPQMRSRGADTVISDEEHKKLIESIPEDLRDVVTALRFTGTRPQMVCEVTAQNFDAEHGIWRLTRHKTGHVTGKPLIVYLAPQLVELCKRLAERYPEGPLFRTARGEPWDASKLSCRIYWYKKKLGLKNLIAYGYRHTAATELLEKGVPDTHVAAIFGHTTTNMVHKHYSHLGSKITNLRNVLINNLANNRDQNGIAVPKQDELVKDQ